MESEKDKSIQRVYHATKKYNLKTIQEEGLEARVGARSEFARDVGYGEEEKKPIICVMDNLEEAIKWTGGLHKPNRDESEQLVILSFELDGTEKIIHRRENYEGAEHVLTDDCLVAPERLFLLKINKNNQVIGEKRLTEMEIPEYYRQIMEEKKKEEDKRWQEIRKDIQ